MKTTGKVWILFDSRTGRKTHPMSLVQAQMEILKLKRKNLHYYSIWTPGWDEWKELDAFIKSDQKFFSFGLLNPKKDKSRLKPSLPPPPPDFTSSTSERAESREPTNSELKYKYTSVRLDEDKQEEKVDYGYFYNEFRGEDLTLSGQIKGIDKIKFASDAKSKIQPHEAMMNRRKHKRYEFRIEVFLVGRIGLFKSFSEDISLSGILLQDEIPRKFISEPFDILIVNKLDPNPKTSRLLIKTKIVGDLSDPRRLSFVEMDQELHERLKALLANYVAHYESLRKKQVN